MQKHSGKTRHRLRSTAGLLLLLPGLCVLLDKPDPGTAQILSAVSPDSILATADALSGETGLGPRSRVARLPSTDVYAAYLRDRLDAILSPLGGSATLEAFDPGFADTPPDPTRDTYTNVIGRLPGAMGGSAPGMFLLGAHFDATSGLDGGDSTWSAFTSDAPGADDNASGIAAILEALRVMAASGLHPQADLMVAFFDAEEQQVVYDSDQGEYTVGGQALLGSTHLADSLSTAGARIYGFVNLDMVAYNPRVDSLVVLTNISSRWLADHLIGVLDNRPGFSQDFFLTRVDKGFPYSDHAPFWTNKYDAVLISEAESIEQHAPHYHRRSDRTATVYSRGGSQAAKAAELLVGLLEEWSWTSADSVPTPFVTSEDILVQDAISIDKPLVSVGEAVDVVVGITNRGGTTSDPWDVALQIEDADGKRLETLGTTTVSEAVPAGGRIKVKFPWIPAGNQKGAVYLRATLTTTGGQTVTARRVLAVEGEPREISNLFVYPNPITIRDLANAKLHYNLSWEGSVRVSVTDLAGQTVAKTDLIFSRLNPAAGTQVGRADVPLATVLQGRSLAPGLYFVRVELFRLEGGSADVAVGKFVVIR